MRFANQRLAVLAGLVMAAGCSDGTGPSGDQGQFNTQRVKDGVAAIERVGANPVLVSFRALGGQMPSLAPPPAGSAGTRLEAVVRDIAEMVAPRSGPTAIPVIRPSILGKTFVYDPAADKYVPSNRTGAPTNGVRFVLYEEGANGKPNISKEIGYADLTDDKASSPNSAGLKLKVVSGQTTYLEYAFELSGSISAATVKVTGYLSDGTERVNFDLTTNSQLFGRGGTVTLEGKIEVPSKQFSIEAKISGEAGNENGAGQVDLTIKSGSDAIVINAKGGPNSINAKVTVNGKLFATVTGNPNSPVIKGEGGRELTADELEALGAMVKFAEGVFELIGGLLAPAAVLLLIGLGV